MVKDRLHPVGLVVRHQSDQAARRLHIPGKVQHGRVHRRFGEGRVQQGKGDVRPCLPAEIRPHRLMRRPARQQRPVVPVVGRVQRFLRQARVLRQGPQRGPGAGLVRRQHAIQVKEQRTIHAHSSSSVGSIFRPRK